ncbi:hypothetical protein J7W19_03040 [Streptomyces mobaraensis NBRC 13819 = DSM 40847]|uniref:Uncharacterized protein n=2 Tax=Streptomyces mobaraensis TaxID=35621 RepID=A0A5N5W4T5_STRMB|nr:hypothetical protein [Streptomyces mobaraensis]EMF00700.1 hypothetical protein H340_10095 [Streptomyces mobaraensis NBRC 13819 = DSM 40847]KAB7839980.1 hypothetical protein FRZ00_20945 [Streptomyces mobaraensis]QTT72546.1 hypothetical protein J7W19_03040 [Streptomyces mobaraensis NBRC 13819 = DSM 40847]
MGTRFIEVDESRRGEPGVRKGGRTLTVGDQSITQETWVKVEAYDDLDPTVTEDVHLHTFAVPGMDVRVGASEGDGDGGDFETRLVPSVQYYRIELGPESLNRLHEALEPFIAAAQECEPPKPRRARGAK